MKNKITAKNKAQNAGAGNYDLSKNWKKNTKDNKQDLQEPETGVLEINLSELELNIDIDIDFAVLLDFELNMQEPDMQELNIELPEIDLGFSDILDSKLVEMSDLDWKDLLEKLNFDIELPNFDIFIEE